ncbi:MAG: ABC transporter permease [Gemmatimonadota bacterium]
MEGVLQDVRYGARTLLKSPVFAATAILTIALGIGATVTIFTLVNAVLLRPLPVEDPDRLVAMEEVRRTGPGGLSVSGSEFVLPRYLEYREASGQVLSGLAAQGMNDVALRAGDNPDAVLASYVSGNYFEVLGVRSALGRAITADEDRPGAPAAVAVLGDHLWRTRFGADPGVVGRTVHLNGYPTTVVGVAPRGFGGTFVGVQTDVWLPVGLYERLNPAADPAAPRAELGLMLFGRLKPGVTPERAEAALSVAARRSEPAAAGDPTTRAEAVRLERLAGLPADTRGMVTGFMAMLLATAGLVLLIAGTNVAGMLLARATVRRREVAIRLAVGAGRGRLVRQLLTESLLLFVLGGTGGLLLALVLGRAVSAFQPPLPVRVALDLGPDARVLGFALLLALGTGVAFGLAPALRASNPDLVSALREGSGGRGAGRTRMRSAFVVAQLAMSLLLLVTAGLFVQALRGALAADLGFEPDGVVAAGLDLRAHGYDGPRAAAFQRRLAERLAGLPGTVSVGMAQFAPLSGNVLTVEVDPPGGSSDGGLSRDEHYANVDEGYFSTLRIPLVAGRGFAATDRAGSPPVVVVNERMARRMWPGENPVGKRLRVRGLDREVVGVARDGTYEQMGEEPLAFLYLPMGQEPVGRATVLVRSRGEPAAALAALRRAVAELDPNVPLREAMPLPASIGLSLFPQRLAAVLVGAFGVLGLVLAAVGVYGLLAFHVGQRRHEIGVRLALGAHTGDVLRMVLRQGMALVALGIAAGLIVALVVTRLLESLLFGVSPTDPLTFAAVPLALCAVALLASWLPARRAARTDPMTALRTE